jgi:hypothetical protein
VSRNHSFNQIDPPDTGLSSATLEAAYEGVFSQLDALASQSLALSNPSSTTPSVPAQQGLYFGRQHGTGAAEITPLDAVSERTEPLSTVPSLRSKASFDTISSLSIARRFPLPSSPSKTGRDDPSGSVTPLATPQRTSDLIKMFEQRGGGSSAPPPPQPSFAPATMSRTSAFASKSPSTSRESSASPPIPAAQPDRRPLEHMFAPPQPAPSSFQAPAEAVIPPPSSYRPVTEFMPSAAPTPPPKSASPLSQVRTMIASWKARTGPPATRVVGSPGKGTDGPKLFSRGDRGWNVSIRRRRRNEDLSQSRGLEETVLAESSEEAPVERSPNPAAPTESSSESGADAGDEREDERSLGRTASARSGISTRSEARTLTGEVSLLFHIIRTYHVSVTF